MTGLRIRHSPTVAFPCAVVQVDGELDMASSPVLEQTLTELLAQGYLHLDLDLADLTFCDSTGLRVMVEARDRLAPHRGTVVVHDPCPALRVLLRICHLDTTLTTRT
ncbi:STAS domain-containing protein [Jannaschia sp. R86511]|uniref:STAS domain-containing protein n=1 Tax=Jannaschia sp. R86511 TaxID=3093853 RepID=UPI0036D431DF